MKATFTLTSILVFFLFLNFSSLSPSDQLFIEIENLSPSLYKDYILESLDNNQLEITEACVPAKVLCVKYTGNSEGSSLNIIKNFFSDHPQSGTVNILSNFNMEDFQDKCSNARLGR